MANTGLFGSFEYDSATDTLTWSDPVYAVHGFVPGDVVPSVDLVLAHKHPDDRAEAARAIEEVRATGRPFSCWHRILDADGNQRQVLAVGSGTFADGRLAGYAGYIVDVTDVLRRSARHEVEAALDGLMRSRPAIEQVKGVLMLTYGLDADAAFELLRRYSQHANVKVREVAQELADALPAGGFPHGSRTTWDQLAAEVRATSAVDGNRRDGAHVDGARVDGNRWDGAHVDGARRDGSRLDGTRVDGARLDGTRVDGARVDGTPLSDRSTTDGSSGQAALD